MQNMRALQPVIEERIDALLARLREHGKTKREMPLDMMYPYSAMTYGGWAMSRYEPKESFVAENAAIDIISEYSFAKSEHAG